MSNQRPKNKVLVGAYVHPQDKQLLKSIASNHEVNLTDIIKASVLKFKSLPKTEQKSLISKVS